MPVPVGGHDIPNAVSYWRASVPVPGGGCTACRSGGFDEHHVVVIEAYAFDVQAVDRGAFEGVAYGRVASHPLGQLDDGRLAAGEVYETRPLKAFQHVEVVGQPPIAIAPVGAAVGGEVRRVEDENHVGHQPEPVEQLPVVHRHRLDAFEVALHVVVGQPDAVVER